MSTNEQLGQSVFQAMAHAVGLPDFGGQLDKEQAIAAIEALVLLCAYLAAKSPHPMMMANAIAEMVKRETELTIERIG